ncbi:MAG TPA: hypothetical protein VN688_33425 [Gemmataceae bacterium]|nr:hypothetical protein [Gemmataceae bacterium]
MYTAYVAGEWVEAADTLAEMRVKLSDVFETGCHEDVVVWDGRRVALILTADGRSLEMAGPMLCWQWPLRRA